MVYEDPNVPEVIVRAERDRYERDRLLNRIGSLPNSVEHVIARQNSILAEVQQVQEEQDTTHHKPDRAINLLRYNHEHLIPADDREFLEPDEIPGDQILQHHCLFPDYDGNDDDAHEPFHGPENSNDRIEFFHYFQHSLHCSPDRPPSQFPSFHYCIIYCV